MKVNILGRQMEIKTELVIIAGAVLILLGCLTGYLLFRDNSGVIIENDEAAMNAASGNTGMISGTTAGAAGGTNAPNAGPAAGINATSAGIAAPGDVTAAQAVTGTALSSEQIEVYVVGCVNKPGIVTLEKGQVIYDAVEKAGGLSAEADADSINMVYKLNENTMLYIKSKRELNQMKGDKAAKPAIKASTTKTSADADSKKEGASGNPGKGAELIEGSGSSVEAVKGGNGGSGGSDAGSSTETESRININTADSAELDKLPGVGEATAREIIAYREKNGPFGKIEDIMKVSRIKQGRFDSIKDLITVN